VERTLAKNAHASSESLPTTNRAVAAPVLIFTLASLVFAFGFQAHFFFNSAPIFKRFTSDVSKLMPLFWVGFSIGMFPASRITKRYGGLLLMGLAGLTGAAAIVVMENATALEIVVAAQFVAGAAWGCILVSAIAAAAALGYSGAEGKTTGLLFSALAFATFTRVGVTATGALNNPTFAPLWHWTPPACWAIAGAVLVGLFVTRRPIASAMILTS
jgi:MFS family permease